MFWFICLCGWVGLTTVATPTESTPYLDYVAHVVLGFSIDTCSKFKSPLQNKVRLLELCCNGVGVACLVKMDCGLIVALPTSVCDDDFL